MAVTRTGGLGADLDALLEQWRAPDASQERLRADFLAQLAAHPDAVHRDGPPEHFTASLLVVDAVGPGLTRVLLTHHRRARMWLQFGGHMEPDDATVRAAAVREGREESGIDDLALLNDLVELDRHDLHGDFVRCRQHLDLRFVAVAPPGVDHVASAESVAVGWFDAVRLPRPCAPDLPRLIERVRSLGA